MSRPKQAAPGQIAVARCHYLEMERLLKAEVVVPPSQSLSDLLKTGERSRVSSVPAPYQPTPHPSDDPRGAETARGRRHDPLEQIATSSTESSSAGRMLPRSRLISIRWTESASRRRRLR
jgi:hypothetical protein